jgi:Tol biopolymer transport system component
VYRTLRDGRQELWQHSIPDGRERRLLADTDAFRSSPRWSPDGASLVYLVSAKRSAAEPEQASLAILSTTDGGERLLRPFDAHQLVPDDWSGDGQSVLGACRSSDPTRSGICLASIGAGAVKMLALAPPFALNNARFSPNQRWISFTHTEGAVGRSTVYVSPIDGGPRIAITDGQAFEDKAHWSPDGRTLYFVSSRGGFLNVWGRRVNPESGQPVGPVFQVTRFDGLRQAFAPDLRFVDLSVTNDRLFVPVTETSRQVWILDDIGR